METRAHHVLIGLFTVIVVAGALLFGLFLAKSSVDTQFKDYEVVFNEAVSGLSKGSSVQYSGIKVGDVITLRLDPNDPRRVLARIRLGGDTPVKEDTQAKLALTVSPGLRSSNSAAARHRARHSRARTVTCRRLLHRPHPSPVCSKTATTC